MTPAETPDLGNMVSRLLEHPELISQIASAIGTGQPRDSHKTDGEVTEPKAQETSASAEAHRSPSDMDAISGMLSLLGGKGSLDPSCNKRIALLSALKPYCNSHRCRTIDHMINISKLSGSFNGLKGGG